MKIPAGIDIYRGRKKLKTGSECPKDLEKLLQKAIEARSAQAKKLGERLAPYENEEKVIASCSAYPEFQKEVELAYRETKKEKSIAKKKTEKDS